MQSESSTTSADLADAITVQTYLRSRASGGPRVGPFWILFSPGDRGPFANYAIPEDGAEPTAAEIAALVATFRGRKRRPRLEYAPAAAPAVEPALLAAGFAVEMRPPLMTRRPDIAVPAPELKGFDLAFVDDAERLDQAARVQTEAFGGDEPDAQWLARTVARGGRVLVAYRRETGTAAGSGAFIPPIDGVTEVVGIAVRPDFRRRGLAQAITAMLAQDAFAAGCVLVFLSAAGEAQSEIYARAGFVRRSPMLFIAKPDD